MRGFLPSPISPPPLQVPIRCTPKSQSHSSPPATSAPLQLREYSSILRNAPPTPHSQTSRTCYPPPNKSSHFAAALPPQNSAANIACPSVHPPPPLHLNTRSICNHPNSPLHCP